LDADVAVDTNFALAHTRTDAVEALVAAFEADLRSVAHTDFEYVPGKHTFARRLELDGGYIALAQTSQTIRRQGRQIESLCGGLAQRENERAHGNKSLRW
jgi:hypothetical protein